MNLLGQLPGVEAVVPIMQPNKLGSREFKNEDTSFNVGNSTIGGKNLTLIAGPCSVENENQINEIAKAVKSGGATILRGGSESFHSSSVITQIIKQSFLNSGLPDGVLQDIPTSDRDAVGHLLKMDDFIDVIVPRGGRSLIERIIKDSRIHVIRHLDGICHTYIHRKSDPNIALKVLINAKMRRTGICGATETILLHKDILKKFCTPIMNKLKKGDCKIYGDKEIKKTYKGKIYQASKKNWGKEYLAACISVKTVKNSDEAINHVNKYGTMHTDAIITKNKKTALKFIKSVKSSIAIHNSSTQFADGGEFGFGGEVGISTNSLPPRGPVGLNQLVSYKYEVMGTGQIRK